MTLFRRLFLVNATIFVLGTLALAVSPATVSFPVRLREALVLVVGLSVMLALNLIFVRLSLAPLERLMSLMRRVDLLRPGQRLATSGPGEVQELGRVFNEMLERLERERRDSVRRALAAQEGERARVARELHDETGQTLGAIVLQLGNLAARVPEALRDDVQLARETARGTLEDVRRIARQLRPEALDDLGLVSALTALTRRFAEQTGLALERRLEPLPGLDPDVELVVYRVAQESLANVARHAEASQVWLSLESVDGMVRLRVADDGVGIRPGAHDGHGISGMRERALLVGGDVIVVDRLSGGVEVRLVVPAA